MRGCTELAARYGPVPRVRLLCRVWGVGCGEPTFTLRSVKPLQGFEEWDRIFFLEIALWQRS